MNLTKNNFEVSTELKKVDSVVLGELIDYAFHILSPVGEISEITNFIRNEFKVDVCDDDIYKILQPQIALQEAELMYKLYGYN